MWTLRHAQSAVVFWCHLNENELTGKSTIMSVPSSKETRQHSRSLVADDTHETPPSPRPPAGVTVVALPRPRRVHLALMNRISRDITYSTDASLAASLTCRLLAVTGHGINQQSLYPVTRTLPARWATIPANQRGRRSVYLHSQVKPAPHSHWLDSVVRCRLQWLMMSNLISVVIVFSNSNKIIHRH